MGLFIYKADLKLEADDGRTLYWKLLSFKFGVKSRQK
jgi:hypothetical protein